MTHFRFTIPLQPGSNGAWPISVNSAYTGNHKLTRPADTWRQTVEGHAWHAWQQLSAGEKALLERAPAWRITCRWQFGRRRRGDLDNYHKLIWDGLKLGTGRDDRDYLPGLDLARNDKGAAPHLTLIVEAVYETELEAS